MGLPTAGCLLISLLFACSSVDGGREQRSVEDCAAAEIACSDTGRDGAFGEDVGPDASHADDWPASGSCVDLTWSVHFPSRGEFSKPDGVEFDPPSKEYMRERLETSGDAAKFITLVAPSGSLTMDRRAYNLFANEGEDVGLQLGMASKVAPEAGDRIFVAVMVDYEPATFRYVHWHDERGGQKDVGEGTGAKLAMRDDAELVDITLPSSALTPGRAHQISVLWARRSFLHPVRNNYSHFTNYMLYYGGYEPPAFPECFEASLAEVANDLENRLIQVNYSPDGLLFPAGLDDADRIREPVAAEAGETVRLNVSLGNERGRRAPRVAIPFINGRPLPEKWFHIYEPWDRDDRNFEMVLRKQFDLELPDEPGTYDVFVGMWEHPLVPVYDLDSEHYSDRTTTSTKSTNTLRFVVE